jgi:hypothetical protein|eukprot:2696672-Prymnesium_polylepis.2
MRQIVPPNQAELMHAALLEKKLPCALKIYEGEQHGEMQIEHQSRTQRQCSVCTSHLPAGFRKAENIEDALNSELFFFSKVNATLTLILTP